MKILLLILILMLAGMAQAEEEPSFRQDPGALVPRDALVQDEEGRRMPFGDLLRGRPLALALIYFHCPNLCEIVFADLMSALGQGGLTAGRDYDLLAISIDPADGPAEAAAARLRHLAHFPLPGAETGLHFLTVDEPDLGRIERSVGFSARFDPAIGQFLHPAGIVLLTPDGRVASYLLGLGYAADQLAAGLKAAAKGHIATPAPTIRLMCFRYDPTTGRYSLAILQALQILGGGAALALAVVLFAVFRRERRL